MKCISGRNLRQHDAGAVVLASEIIESERRLVSAGLDNPDRLHAAAVEHGVTSESFADPVMRYIFWALCRGVDVGHRTTEADVIALARRHGFPLPLGIYNWFHDLRMLEHGLGGVGCGNYARAVAEHARVRARYRELHEEAQALIPDAYRLPADPGLLAPRTPHLRLRGRVVA